MNYFLCGVCIGLTVSVIVDPDMSFFEDLLY